MTLDQDFPASIEYQLLGGDGKNQRTTANLCTGNQCRHARQAISATLHESKSKTYHGEQWVTAEVEVHGSGEFKHIMEGETVLSYTNRSMNTRQACEQLSIGPGCVMIKGGYIALQSESHSIDFRKVEIQILDAE